MNGDGGKRGLTLYVCSGLHLGARLDLGTGSWVLGSDDSCDIILSGLAARHAVLEVSSSPAGDPSATLSPLDGEVRLHDGGATPSAPDDSSALIAPSAGSALWLGHTCFVWNRPGVEQPLIDPDACRPHTVAASSADVGADSVLSEGNEVAMSGAVMPVEDDKMMGAALSGVALPAPLVVVGQRKRRPLMRFFLLGLAGVMLAGLSVAVAPPVENSLQYPSVVEKYLADAGIAGLSVSLRGQGVEVRGSVEDDAAMIRLRDMARALHFPVYLEVGVREDIVRAVRSSLAIRGFHPQVDMVEDEASPRLTVAAYIKDTALEEAAFAALESEVKGLPVQERRIVHEKELAPVLEEALKKAGLSSVRVLYLPGQVDFAGDFRPEDAPALLRLRRDAEQRFGVPLYGRSSFSAALPAASTERAAVRPHVAAERLSSSGAPGRSKTSRTNEEQDPLGGLRVTGVTMSPMRFIVTADGRRLFEGAKLPGGCILEGIGTKVLTLRRGDHVFTYMLRGSHD